MSGGAFDPFAGTIPIDQVKPVETPKEMKVKDMISESAGKWNKIFNAVSGKKEG